VCVCIGTVRTSDAQCINNIDYRHITLYQLVTYRRTVQVSQIEVVEPKAQQQPHTA